MPNVRCRNIARITCSGLIAGGLSEYTPLLCGQGWKMASNNHRFLGLLKT